MSAPGRIRHPSRGTSIVPFDAHRLGRPKAAAATAVARSDEPKVHCCYFAGRRRAGVRAGSKAEVTKDDAQKVVTIISGDKAKTQTYCEIQKLTQQMEQAYEKNDSKTADELSEKIDTLEDTLGPEYAELINGLQDIDPEKDKLGAEIMSMFEVLDRLCTK
jgi:hypothetical protein